MMRTSGAPDEWMKQRLVQAIWVKPVGLILDEVETAVMCKLRPLLTLDKAGDPRERLRSARKQMADLARAWQPNAARGMAGVEASLIAAGNARGTPRGDGLYSGGEVACSSSSSSLSTSTPNWTEYWPLRSSSRMPLPASTSQNVHPFVLRLRTARPAPEGLS